MKRRFNMIALVSAAALVASVYTTGRFFWSERVNTVDPVKSLTSNGVDTLPSATAETGEDSHSVPWNNIQLSAKSAVVVDLRNGTVMFGHNEKAQLPLASLTKLITLATFPREEKESPITIAESSLALEGDSGLRLGEKWDRASLMALTLVSSSNDGAHALAEDANPGGDDFVVRMNEKAKELGLEQTYFLNPTGLDQGSELGGAYGSALDMVRLITEVLTANPEILEATRYPFVNLPREGEADLVVRNTNSAVEKLPGIVASKTGFTDTAGGNLVVVIEAGPGIPIGIAVLGASLEGRFSDVETLAWAALRHVGRGE